MFKMRSLCAMLLIYSILALYWVGATYSITALDLLANNSKATANSTNFLNLTQQQTDSVRDQGAPRNSSKDSADNSILHDAVAVEKEHEIPKCNDFIAKTPNGKEIVVDPTEVEGFVLTQLTVPNDFPVKQSVDLNVVDQLFVDMDGKQIFGVDANTNELILVSEEMPDSFIHNFNAIYDQVKFLNILASDGNHKCTFQIPIRLFSAYWVYEPEWEANPPLNYRYDIEMDCPKARDNVALLGHDGRPFVNITYLWSEPSDVFFVHKFSSQVYTLDKVPKQDFLYKLRVRAESPGERPIEVPVEIKTGHCSKEVKPVETPVYLVEKLKFAVPCVRQSMLLIQLPNKLHGHAHTVHNVTSYELRSRLFPEHLSVTRNGQLRVMSDDWKGGVYTFLILMNTNEASIFKIYDLEITAGRCPPARKIPQLWKDLARSASKAEGKLVERRAQQDAALAPQAGFFDWH